MESDSSSVQNDKHSLIESVRIYPSPNNGSFIIENSLNEKVIADIRTINGIQLSANEIEKHSKIQLNNLSAGMLIVEVYTKNRNLVVRKLLPVIHP